MIDGEINVLVIDSVNGSREVVSVNCDALRISVNEMLFLVVL